MSDPAMTGDSSFHARTLGNALRLYGEESRRNILDSLGCYLHNEGHALKGNTEGMDCLWLAKTMAAKARGTTYNDWDQLPAEEKAKYQKFARIAFSCLPALCDRIASRYINMAVAVRSAEEIEKAMQHESK